MATLDIHAYLARIHDQGPLEPNAETLRRLHLAHLLTREKGGTWKAGKRRRLESWAKS